MVLALLAAIPIRHDRGGKRIIVSSLLNKGLEVKCREEPI